MKRWSESATNSAGPALYTPRRGGRATLPPAQQQLNLPQLGPRQWDRAYEDALIERLRDRYLSKTPLPGEDGTPLTLACFYRLYRAVLAEGYGDEVRAKQREP